MKLRSRPNTSINLINGERLPQLKLIVYFFKDKNIKAFLSTAPNYTMLVV
jgi:hypothetical protein